MAKERRAKRQKNFHLIQEATSLWEVLRQTATPPEKKKELVGKIVEVCGERVPELAMSHTAARIIQACVKHGTDEDRARLQKLCLPKIIELSKSPYGRFVVSKLINKCPKGDLIGELVLLVYFMFCFLWVVDFERPLMLQYCVILLIIVFPRFFLDTVEDTNSV